MTARVLKSVLSCCCLLAVVKPLPSLGQCPPGQNRVLLVGDSWAELMWNHRNLKRTFDAFGRADVLEYNPPSTPADQRTAISGMTAAAYNTPSFLQRVTDALAAQPSIDLVHISLGGNDFLGGWKASMTPAQEEALFNGIRDNIAGVVQHCLNQRPDIRVAIVGYDFLNFFDTGGNSSCVAMWLLMDGPSVRRLNDALTGLEAKKRDLAQSMGPRVRYVHNLGLMQFWAGYPPWFGPFFVPAPGGPPAYTPFPGGNPDFPTHTSRLADNGSDCIHLNVQGYDELALNAYNQFYAGEIAFAPSMAQFSSEGGLNEGYIYTDTSANPVGVNTSTLRLGEQADNTFTRTIVSFDTSALPDDAVVTGARLWLTRSGGTGINPFTHSAFQTPVVDVRTGSFNNQPALELADFNAPATASNSACVVGTAPTVPSLLRIDFTPAGAAAINPAGRTQVRIYFPGRLANFTADFLTFYDGDASSASNRPLLEVDYVLPTSTPTPTATHTFSPTNTASPTWTVTPTATSTSTVTPTMTATFTTSATPSFTPTVTASITPSSSPTPTTTATPTWAPSATPTFTPLPSATPTPSVTATSSTTPTASPTPTPPAAPTATPSPTATGTPVVDCTGPAPGNPCVPGTGLKKTNCHHEWLLTPVPPRTRRGVPKNRLVCYEGDPRCDVGSGANDGVCVFSVRLCLNQQDARLAECTPSGIEAMEIQRPFAGSVDPADIANFAALEQAAAAFGVAIYRNGQVFHSGVVNSTRNVCGESVQLVVPLRQAIAGRWVSGRRLFQVAAYTTHGQVDTDRLALVCRPSTCGNGRLDAGEECDDGNRSDGDGCDRACRIE